MRSPHFLKTHPWENRNPYFHLHPMQGSYALTAVLVSHGTGGVVHVLGTPLRRRICLSLMVILGRAAVYRVIGAIICSALELQWRAL